MRVYIKILLIYSLILSPVLGVSSSYGTSTVSSGLNPFVQSILPEAQRGNLFLANGMVNEYRLLGYKSFPTMDLKEFKRALKTRVTVLNKDFRMSESNLRSPQLYNEALRQYRQVYAALQVEGVIDYENISDKKAKINRQVLEDFKSKSFQSSEHKRKHVLMEEQRRFVETLTEEQRLKVNNRITLAKKALNTTHKRAAFNLRSGLSLSGEIPRFSMNFSPRVQFNNIMGRASIPVEDQFGKRTTVAWEKDPRTLKKINAAELSRAIADGFNKKNAFNVTKLGVAFMIIMYGAALYKMGTAYEQNPMAFENTLDQTLSVTMPLSIASFFVGGAATQIGTGYFNAQRKSIAAISHIHEEYKRGLISSETRSKLLKAHMNTIGPKKFLDRALTNRGLAGGLIISKLVYLAAHKGESCFKSIGNKNYEHLPQYKRDELDASCNRGWGEIMNMVFANPQTWMEITALLSTKALMTWGMNTSLALRFGAFANNADRALINSAKNSASRVGVNISPKGIITSPAVRVIFGFATFSVVFHVILWRLEKVYNQLSIAIPANQSRKKIEDLFVELKQSGWDLESVCRSSHFDKGFFTRTFKALWFWNNNDTCGAELVDAFINHHAEKQKIYRESLLTKVEEAKVQWQNYNFKVLNSYKASYLLYKDIAEQVKIKRSQNVQLPFDKNPIDQVGQFYEPLALFRADPFFGWNYTLKDSDLEKLSYPIHNGVGVNWTERAESDESSLMIEKRMERFLTVVIPELINHLNSFTIYANDETKSRLAEILSLLNTGDFNKVLKALDQIYQATRKETLLNNCSAKSVRYDKCFFHIVQDRFLDPEIWQSSDEGLYSYLPKTLAGYSIIKNNGMGTELVTPYGIKPIGMGQRFFIEYNDRLNNNGIDTLYYPKKHASITDYLTYEMIFGEKTNKNNISRWLGLTSPYFKPPPVPTKNLLDVKEVEVSNSCRAYFSADPQINSACSDYNDANYYTGLYVDGDLAFNSLSEYFYEELSDEFVNDFDTWWKENVAPEFERDIVKVYEKYFVKKVIESDFNSIMNRDNYVSTCRAGFCQSLKNGKAKGYKASVTQQVDNLFSGVLDELVQTLPLDLKYSEIANEDAGRRKLHQQYFKLKSDLYKIIDEITVRGQGFELGDSLWEDYNSFKDEIFAHSEVSESDLPPNIIHLLTIKSLLQKRIYQLSVLFKLDSESMIDAYRQVAVALIQNSDEFDEGQKNEAISELDKEVLQMKQDRQARLQRDGLVLIEYTDWPDDPNDDNSPTRVGVVFPALTTIGIVIEELFQKKFEQEMILNDYGASE